MEKSIEHWYMFMDAMAHIDWETTDLSEMYNSFGKFDSLEHGRPLTLEEMEAVLQEKNRVTFIAHGELAHIIRAPRFEQEY